MAQQVNSPPRRLLGRHQHPGGAVRAVPGAVDSEPLTQADPGGQDGKLIPSQITFDNYKGIFTGDVFTSALINSIGIALITTLIAVVVGGMAAYAVARLGFLAKRLLIGAALLIAMFPKSRW